MRRIVVKYKVLGSICLVVLLVTGLCIYKLESKDLLDSVSWRSPHATVQEGKDPPLITSGNSPMRLWFMTGGSIHPAPGPRMVRLWPEEDTDDRIVNQLMFVPEVEEGVKTLWVDDRKRWAVGLGNSAFKDCPVDSCVITADRINAHALLFRDNIASVRGTKIPPSQIWIMYLLENPYYSGKVKQKDSVNWTATYRSDSDIVAPYEKWVYYDPAVRQRPTTINHAANKTKKVAWFVSNCRSKNNRLAYAKELQQHIDVDIYGECGSLSCPRSSSASKNGCLEMLRRDYKFYLSFENANCRHYITEKLYLNGLQYGILPIVMGAHPEDYRKQTPHHSYIHVDDFPSARDLAGYLYQLDNDDDLYNSYFQWQGTGEFVNTHFMCRLCAMLHDSSANAKYYPDFDAWWRASDTCRQDSWTA